MLENCLMPNVLQFKTTRKDVGSEDDSIVIPVKKRHVISDLPLKKRYQQKNGVVDGAMIKIPKFQKLPCDDLEHCKHRHDDEDDINLNAPVDFSLPNRTRAICTNSTANTEIIRNDTIQAHSHVDDLAKAYPLFTSPDELMLCFSDYLRYKLPHQISSLQSPSFSPILPPHSVNSNDRTRHEKVKRESNYKKCEKFLFVEPQSLPVERYNNSMSNRTKKLLKNMTTERRMEANARERTRVHTISAAFENVRKLIPCYSSDQKLSKLSILRLACNYIMLLASLNNLDYSADERNYTVEECIEIFTETLNVEAKFKRY